MDTRALLAIVALALAACGDDDVTSPDGGAAADAAQRDAESPVDSAMTDTSVAGDGGGEVVTTLRIVYPSGATIRVRGEGPLSWESGRDVPEASPGLYVLRATDITEPIEWKPLLEDETWARGPNYHVAPGETVEIAPHFTETNGRVVELVPSWDASTLAHDRTVWAYLPASYEENTEARYPVVYMHDGQNLFDPALAFGGTEWGVDETMDTAAELGRCAEGATCTNDGECTDGSACETFRQAIVIGIANSAARMDEYTPTVDADYGAGGLADDYLDALVLELAPMVNEMLRTLEGPEHTAIVGSSLGGIVSSYAGVTRADTFGLVGSMSPATWWDDRAIIDVVASIPSRAERATRLYVDSGDSGPSSDGAADTALLVRAYEDAGYVQGDDLLYVLAPGHQHNEAYWRERLPVALRFLLGRRERRDAP